MDIAVFGCGYVGTAFVREASRRGLNVWALTRNEERIQELSSLPGVTSVKADIMSASWEQEFPTTVKAVINTVSASTHGEEGYRSAYVDSNQRLTDFLQGRSTARYIYTGSTGIYPQANGEVVREEDANAPATPNGKILKEAEDVVLGAEHIPTRVILRLCGIYGPGRHYILDKLRKGETAFPDSGEHFMNLVYVDDIVSSLFTALETPEKGAAVYNVADGNPALKKEAVAWLCQQMDLPTPAFGVEDSGGGRSAGRRLEGGNIPSRQISNEKICQETNWKPQYKSYQEGFGKILEE